MRTRSAVTAAVRKVSDDEAPEEISLATGREAAVSQQYDESHAVLEQQRAAKEKRRKRAALAKPAAAEASKSTAGEAAVRGAGGAASATEDEELDLLPEHVVAALTRSKRESTLALPAAEGAQDSASPVGPASLKAERKMRPRRERPRLGPVTVEVLSGVAPTKPSDSALAFARRRIAGVKRSREMLAPLKAGGLRVFAPARAFKLS